MTAGPFGTRALRDAALAAWTRSPARLREDANAEEDHARGWYRDRVVVELAQNAADAAARAGVPGTLHLELLATVTGTLLVASNTGAPLDADGVAALASLRASAKRDAPSAVGRFGVGFAAVRSVADEISLTSTAGSVHFSLAGTRDALADAPPALAEEVTRRGDVLPVLRLPFDGPGPLGTAAHRSAGTAQGTTVALLLRDDAAVRAVRAQLDAVDDVLLLALPGLERVVVRTADGEREVSGVADRWVVAARSGVLPPALLADRPVEERTRTRWQVVWAVPRHGGDVPGTVHAPTPTDEPCSVPAVLVATFPLDPTRRHVAAGPLTDAVVEHAAATWPDLLAAARDAGLEPLDLLPTGLPAAALDASLCAAVLAATSDGPVLPAAAGGPRLVPRDAVLLEGPGAQDPGLLEVLARHLPALADVPLRHRSLARRLGAGETDLAEVVDSLPADPAVTHAVLDAAGPDPAVLEQLAGVGVLLADGRVVRGARGLVLPVDLPPAVGPVLAGWGVRLVAPEAAHPLLERLGAEPAGPADLLRHPVVRHRVLEEDDEDDAPGPAARVMLELARAAPDAEPEPWWSEVLLPAADGEVVPARGLVLPGSPAHRWYDEQVLAELAADVVDRWGRAPVVLGVREGLTVVRVEADDDGLVTDGLDGWDGYLDALAGRVGVAVGLEDVETPVTALADLDAVQDGAWPEVLAELARSEARRTLDPVGVGGDGEVVAAPSYTTWWLRHRSPLGLDRPFALTGADEATRDVLPPAPAALAGLDEGVQRLLGGTAHLSGLDLAGWDAVLGPVGTPVEAHVAVAVWRALLDPGPVPDRVPALTADGAVAVHDVGDVAVVDPMWLQHPGVRPCLPAPPDLATELADRLDLDLGSDRGAGRVTSRGAAAPTPDAVRRVWPAAPAQYVEHEDLQVDGLPVDWWVQDGVPHAGTTAGLAQALAWLVGWSERGRVARVLAGETELAVLLDAAGDEPR